MTKAKSKASGKVIDFNTLLGNWPSINIGDVIIEGRHVNQREKLAWLEAEAAGDADQQRVVLVDLLNARGAEVDAEWLQQWPDAFLVALVKGLHGLGWPGEEGGESGNA